MKLETKEKVQWNTRIRAPYKQAALTAAGLYGCRTQDELAEIALRVLLGCEGPEISARRERVKKAWITMGDKLPFETTPTDNVKETPLLTQEGLGVSFQFRPVNDCAFSSVVEHHPDTVAVGGSTPPARTNSEGIGNYGAVQTRGHLPALPSTGGTSAVAERRVRPVPQGDRHAVHDDCEIDFRQDLLRAA